ncbi:hypothetical protein D2Q93_11395 [Alicyclobacillaceae bacterium I2511]|nr:hypothetical protein D2Q93_11395 [Alicyclobacillaceae bacterium I2511]
MRHPNVAISSGLWAALDESARKAVLYYEVAHVWARDPLQQTLLQVLSYALRPLGMASLYQRYLIRRCPLQQQLTAAKTIRRFQLARCLSVLPQVLQRD